MVDLNEMIRRSVEAYEKMSPIEKARHDYDQWRSLLRGLCPSDTPMEDWCKTVDRVMPPIDFLKTDTVEKFIERAELGIIAAKERSRNLNRDGIDKLILGRGPSRPMTATEAGNYNKAVFLDGYVAGLSEFIVELKRIIAKEVEK